MQEDRELASPPRQTSRKLTGKIGVAILVVAGLAILLEYWGAKWNVIVGVTAAGISMFFMILTARHQFLPKERKLRNSILLNPGLTLFFAGGSFVLWDAYAFMYAKSILGAASLLSFVLGYILFMRRHRG